MSAEIIPFKKTPIANIAGFITAARDAALGATYSGILDEARSAAVRFCPQMPDWVIVQIVDGAIEAWRAERQCRR